MSKYFAWWNGSPRTIYWRKYNHPHLTAYRVYLDDDYMNMVMKQRGGTWKAIVTQTPKSRGPSLGGFANRYEATKYMFWAHGFTDYGDRP